MHTTNDFTQLVKLCLAIAEEKYGALGPVAIRYDLRGRAAGMACCKISRLTGEASDLALRFNREAMQLDWDHMVRETIPHEIAHLVAYAKPELGAKNHNAQWRRISQTLGCKGERCHKIQLTPARRVTRYKYRTDSGREVLAGPKHHKMIQMHGKLAGLRDRNTRELLDRHHFVEAIAA